MSLTLQHSEEKFRRSVEISNLVKEYPNPYGEDFRVVENFNLNIQEGEFISLIGHSGCGKSTVLTMLAGLNEISDGGIIVGAKEIGRTILKKSLVSQKLGQMKIPIPSSLSPRP